MSPARALLASLPAPLAAALGRERASDPEVREMFHQFLSAPGYSRPVFRALIALARGECRSPWEIRAMAALMLEELLSSLSEPSPAEVNSVLSLLGLLDVKRDELPEWLLAEGFTARTPPELFAQLQRKLGSLPMAKPMERSRSEWRRWLRRSEQDCRLPLARYLFQPQEVVDRILSMVATSMGVPDTSVEGLPAPDETPSRQYDPRPYEAAILALLASRGIVYWVCSRTPSAVNSMVEYPLGTVVLTIKPPGSDLEIEIKRAGMRERPLDALYERDSGPVPEPHRLQGGSMGSTLQWEARKSLDLAVFYSAAQGRPAPMSRMIGLTSVNTLPAAEGDALLLDYFTDPDIFGRGFSRMRREMAKAFAALHPGQELPTGLALTVAFMQAMKPKQAILAGTSSFRLDLVRAYLSAEGSQLYAAQVFGRQGNREDAQLLASDVLEQVLGVFDEPAGTFRDVEAYAAAVFAIPVNRARADAAFLRCVSALANFCGCLWSIGGYAQGESVVERNVGIVRQWQGGEWLADLVLMDHDGLILPGPDVRNFRPQNVIPGMKADERYLFGRMLGHPTIRGSIPCLWDIYRADPALEAQGEALFRAEFARSCRNMRQALLPRGRLRRYIRPRYIGQLLDFYALAAHYAATGQSPPEWERTARSILSAKQYHPELSDEYVAAIRENAAFLARHPALYEDANLSFNRS